MQRLVNLTTKIGSGATPRGGKNAYKGGDFSLIRSQNILDFSFSYDGLVKINNEQANALSNVEVQIGDVLLNITGDSVARCCQVDPACLPARVNQHVCIIRPNPQLLDSTFLKYFLLETNQKQNLLILASAGATRNALTKVMVEELEIPDFDVCQQKAIAHILSTLDDKIELNQKMNQTLEDIAKAIFKSWFVDFDPVRAKAEGRPTGLPPEISDLFPDELVDSEIGEIPKGWEVTIVSDFGKVVCGKTPSTKDPDNFEGEFPFITIPDMRGNLINLSTERSVSEKGATVLKGKLLPAGSICISCIATPGLVSITSCDSFTNQQINSIVPGDDVDKEYLLFSMMTFGDLISSAGSGGSVFANLSTGRFKELPILRANEKLRSAFSRLIRPILQRIELSQKEIYTLSELRDTLLPKLTSGELRIPDAEKFLEEAGI